MNSINSRLLFGVVLFFTLPGISQKIHEDQLVGTIKEVHLRLERIDQIRLIQSKEAERFSIRCQADFMIPAYQLEYKNDHVFVHSQNFEEVNEVDGPPGKECSEDPRYNSYILSIPVGAKVFVELDHGNVYATELSNDLYLKSISGIVKIKPQFSFSYVELERGNVYIEDQGATDYQLKTRKGKFYKNMTVLTQDIQANRSWNQISDQSSSKVEIITVSANVYIDSSKPKI